MRCGTSRLVVATVQRSPQQECLKKFLCRWVSEIMLPLLSERVLPPFAAQTRACSVCMSPPASFYSHRTVPSEYDCQNSHSPGRWLSTATGSRHGTRPSLHMLPRFCCQSSQWNTQHFCRDAENCILANLTNVCPPDSRPHLPMRLEIPSAGFEFNPGPSRRQMWPSGQVLINALGALTSLLLAAGARSRTVSRNRCVAYTLIDSPRRVRVFPPSRVDSKEPRRQSVQTALWRPSDSMGTTHAT